MTYLLFALALYALAVGGYLLSYLGKLRRGPFLEALLLGGFIFYCLDFGRIYLQAGKFPVGDPYGIFALLGNMLVMLFLLSVIAYRERVRDLGLPVAIFGFVGTFLGLPAKEVGYKNPFYVYHVLSASLAYAFLMLAGLSSFIKYFMEKKLKAKDPGSFSMPLSLVKKLERFFLNSGFVFLTLTLLFGSLWAKSFLGSHWVDDPKLLLTLGLWIYYAFIVHINLIRGLKPSILSTLSVVGFLLVLLNLALIRHSVYAK